MAPPPLDPYHCEIFRKNHPFDFSKRLKKWVNIPCPKDGLFNSFFITSKNKDNDVDINGNITVKDTIYPYFSKLFKKKKMNKELIIFCHDNYNRKSGCHEGRLFRVKMIDYKSTYNEKNERFKYYFCFKIIERITPNGYSYYP